MNNPQDCWWDMKSSVHSIHKPLPPVSSYFQSFWTAWIDFFASFSGDEFNIYSLVYFDIDQLYLTRPQYPLESNCFTPCDPLWGHIVCMHCVRNLSIHCFEQLLDTKYSWVHTFCHIKGLQRIEVWSQYIVIKFEVNFKISILGVWTTNLQLVWTRYLHFDVSFIIPIHSVAQLETCGDKVWIHTFKWSYQSPA